MRKVSPKALDLCRRDVTDYGFPPTRNGDLQGFFILPTFKTTNSLGTLGDPSHALALSPGPTLKVISSGNEDSNWEHVSVSVVDERRCPTWEEMCFVKDLFWEDEEQVLQFHPPKSQYINKNEYVLHLWKHKQLTHPLPPKEYV